jgi:hypothetical protein
MLRRLSEQLQAKESGKGSSMYQPKPGSAVQWPRRIDRSSFDRAFRVAANRVQT